MQHKVDKEVTDELLAKLGIQLDLAQVRAFLEQLVQLTSPENIATSAAEDSQAGDLGKPFPQMTGFGDGDKEDDEEWISYIKWSELPSGSSM